MAIVNNTLLANEAVPERAPRFHTLDEWLTWQEGLHFTAIDLGLDRCRMVAETMNLLQPEYTVISVAGTNGKGSSVTMLDLMLRRSGYKTGKYTSPHLLCYNERVCLDGAPVSDEILCQAFERIDQARGNISLTFFEFGTLAALDIFRQADIQIAVMEVGLGGRLDALNIVDADAALITSIDIDHENWLGSDRNSIGAEKAGILRKHKPAVCSDPEPPASILEYARLNSVKLELLGTDYSYQVRNDVWDWQSESLTYKGLIKPSVYDDCQMQNAAGALMLLKTLADEFPLDYDAVTSTMKDFRLQGRFQVVPGVVPTILDVAHNRQSAQLLAKNLARLPVTGRTFCIMGMLKDKNHEHFFREMTGIVDIWCMVDLGSERAARADDLAGVLRRILTVKEINTFMDVDMAMAYARQHAQPGDRIVVTGSFLTVRAGLICLRLDT